MQKGHLKIPSRNWSLQAVFIVPGWMTHARGVSEGALVFLCSGRAMQDKLGIWRKSQEAV